MKKNAFADYIVGLLNAIVKKLGGKDGAFKFLRGKTSVSEPEKSWRENDGVIYFTVTSDGTTGAEWIARLEKKGFRVGDYAKSVLRSTDFKPTTGITTEVAVLKGILFKNKERADKNIRTVAGVRKLETPNAEIVCLIREKFTDKDIKAMGLIWILTMHDPIKNPNGNLNYLLGASRDGSGRSIGASYDKPGIGWERGGGFAFAVSQVSQN